MKTPSFIENFVWKVRMFRESNGIGHVLQKAIEDNSFNYACGLRCGAVVRFVGARRVGRRRIHLEDARCLVGGELHVSSDRGLEVSIADIVWAVDDPMVNWE